MKNITGKKDNRDIFQNNRKDISVIYIRKITAKLIENVYWIVSNDRTQRDTEEPPVLSSQPSRVVVASQYTVIARMGA